MISARPETDYPSLCGRRCFGYDGRFYPGGFLPLDRGSFMQAEEIKSMIEQGLPDATVEVSGDDGVHFEAVIVSPAFAGKRTLERHRMVYTALGSKMGGDIHALSMRTLAPGEPSGES
jgi:acid stress-induced BolA-like protein IbaG/YrbA